MRRKGHGIAVHKRKLVSKFLLYNNICLINSFVAINLYLDDGSAFAATSVLSNTVQKPA
jgi:hypothetical protein